VVSHISQKTSEIWGTRKFVAGTEKSLLASFQIFATPFYSLGRLLALDDEKPAHKFRQGLERCTLMFLE
jgi:hypothetical protein